MKKTDSKFPKFLITVAGACILVFGVAIIVQNLYTRSAVIEQFQSDIDRQLSLRKEQLEQAIELDKRKIQFLHATPPIQGIVRASKNNGVDPYDNTSLDLWKERLETIFISYISYNPDIYQIRFIGANNNGLELVRVDRVGGAIAVSKEGDLQEKGGTDYFSAISKLAPGAVYLSDISLNREHGTIEFPYRPTLRIAEGVYGEGQEFFGFIIINSNANALLNSINTNLNETLQLYLLNSTGGFLIHPDENKSFDFEFNEQSSWKNSFRLNNTKNKFESKKKFWDHYLDLEHNEPMYLKKSSVPLSIKSENRFIEIVVSVDDSTINAEVASHRLSNMLVLGLTILSAFLLITYYQHNFNKKIKSMTDQATFKAIVEGSKDAVVAMDINGVINSWNDSASEIFSYSEHYAIGKSVFKLFVDNSSKIFNEETLSKVFEGFKVESFDTEAKTRAGSSITISVTLSPITMDTGKTIGVAAIIRDVTEQRTIEAQILNINIELEKQVSERTKELEVARNEALAASKTKSEFIANVSHEIRTPMNGVLGTLNILRRESLSDKQQRLVTMAETSAKALTSLINDILDLSKIEAGKLDIDNEDFDFLSLVSDLANSFGVNVYAKNLEMVLDLSELRHQSINGDENRLRQIIIYLLSNALKFTESGEIVLSASTKELAAGDIELKCTVQDTGIGIAEDKLAILFDAFTQEDSSTSKKFGGTGLGLNISQRLCQMMGGTIEVESTKGKGSSFSFTVLAHKSSKALDHFPVLARNAQSALLYSNSKTLARSIYAQLKQWSIECTIISEIENLRSISDEELESYNTIYLDITANSDTVLDLSTALSRRIKEGAQRLAVFKPSNLNFSLINNIIEIEKPISPKDLWKTVSVANTGASINSKIIDTTSDNAPKNSLTVLLVDDNPINIEVGCDLLQESGARVVTAENGSAAITLLKKHGTDIQLILMDCQMPVMDGYETTAIIRKGDAGEELRNIPIIAMTANAMAGAKEECLNAGMNDYLTKPINVDAFNIKLQHWAHLIPTKEKPILSEPEDLDSQDPSATQDLARKTTGTTCDPSVWDIDAALMRLKNRNDRLLKLAKIFSKDLASKLDTFKEHAHSETITAKQLEEIHFMMHNIKGAAGSLEARALFKLAQAIELAAIEGKPEEIKSMAQDFEEQSHNIIQAIAEFENPSLNKERKNGA